MCKGMGEDFIDINLLILSKTDPLLDGGVSLFFDGKESLIKKMTEVYLSTINKNTKTIAFNDLDEINQNNLCMGQKINQLQFHF